MGFIAFRTKIQDKTNNTPFRVMNSEEAKKINAGSVGLGL